MKGLYPIIRRKRRPLLAEAEVARPTAPAVSGPVATAQVAQGAGDVVVATAVSSLPVDSPTVEPGGAASAISKPKRSHHKKATPQAN